MITNLLSNAFKYGAGKPVEVTVEGRRAGARARLSTAASASPRQAGGDLRALRRAAPKNQGYGGFGLGLWITRQLLQEMGGTIRVESEEGAGAMFEIELAAGPRLPMIPGG